MKTQMRRSLLRRRNALAVGVALLSWQAAVCVLAHVAAQSPAKAEREVEDRIPKHLPIRVKIKKLEKLKEASNEEWVDDMEIEVTNTGEKPIYFLSMLLKMPDVLAANGNPYVFEYFYGRVYLADFSEPVQSGDVPLQRGETVTLKPADNWIRGWKRLRAKGGATNPKKLEFIFQEINHGDGTGFLGTSGTPMPIKRERGPNSSCSGGSKGVGDAAADSPPRVFLDSVFAFTPLSPPVSFMPAASSSQPIRPEPAAKRDICCQTSRPECTWIKPGGQSRAHACDCLDGRPLS